jgi:hypothetical protein
MTSEVVLVERPEVQVVEVEQRLESIVERVQQGPAGPPGPVGPSGASSLSFVAGEALGGHRVVKLNPDGFAYHASADTPGDLAVVVGVTLGACSLGATADVIRSGEIIEPSWTWVPGLPIFLGLNGVLTQTLPPGAVFSLVVGVALTPVHAVFSPREPVLFGA